MGDLSLHFSRDEFRCRGEQCCGHSAPVDMRLVEGLEEVRARLNEKLTSGEVRLEVTSGFRCLVHNREVGSSDFSLHALGMAADVVPHGAAVGEVAICAGGVRCFRYGGIGVYDEFVHLDVRGNGPARW